MLHTMQARMWQYYWNLSRSIHLENVQIFIITAWMVVHTVWHTQAYTHAGAPVVCWKNKWSLCGTYCNIPPVMFLLINTHTQDMGFWGCALQTEFKGIALALGEERRMRWGKQMTRKRGSGSHVHSWLFHFKVQDIWVCDGSPARDRTNTFFFFFLFCCTTCVVHWLSSLCVCLLLLPYYRTF